MTLQRWWRALTRREPQPEAAVTPESVAPEPATPEPIEESGLSLAGTRHYLRDGWIAADDLGKWGPALCTSRILVRTYDERRFPNLDVPDPTKAPRCKRCTAIRERA